jgi:hypothetical protein
MILIHPPVSKPCEPPAGIAKLCGALNHHRIKNKVLDANLEGLLNLFETPLVSSDRWISRAQRHLSGHLTLLRCWDAYQNESRYHRAIKDLNRILEITSNASRVYLSLANYKHEKLSPARSIDLVKAAENPENNPFSSYFKKRLTELMKSDQPSVIGFSLNFLSQALCTFAMIGFIRREWPHVKLVLGGGLVTSWMSRPNWLNPFKGLLDHLVAGPGEVPLLSLIHGKGLKGSDERRFSNDHYKPDYHSLPIKDYFAPGPILPYSASVGCYWNRCTFCPEKAEGNHYVAIPVDQVILDLHWLVNRHKPILIHFLDEAMSPSLMEEISEHPPGVPWYGFVRVTHHLTDPDFCLALKRSGCVMLKFGLESGDQSVLDHLQKGVILEQASLALKNLKKAGIATYVYLLFGTPPEGQVEAQRTFEFVVKHDDCIGFLNLAIFNMPIYGPEAQQMETKTFYEGDLSLYTGFNHPKGWSRKLIKQFLDKKFKRHPAIASILRRDPPVFTSNHAPFFVMNREVEG